MAIDVGKEEVREFWNQSSCGEAYAEGASPREQLERQARTRYELEPYLADFAKFADGSGKDVLEIGVGMGADHLEWARARPRSLTGIDLTPRAIDFTRKRLELHAQTSDLRIADAEKLPFDDASFDLVYSWGVLHHTTDTPRAIQEVLRVLRPGGVARIMIYQTYSMVGYMLWLRYGLLAGRPWRSLGYIYAHYLESPGTKAYTLAEARQMCAGFSAVNVRAQLTFGDLLQGGVGQRHRGLLLSAAKALYPRWAIERLLRGHGLDLLIEATK
jgi:SAM-dependent methyltransferase